MAHKVLQPLLPRVGQRVWCWRTRSFPDAVRLLLFSPLIQNLYPAVSVPPFSATTQPSSPSLPRGSSSSLAPLTPLLLASSSVKVPNVVDASTPSTKSRPLSNPSSPSSPPTLPESKSGFLSRQPCHPVTPTIPAAFTPTITRRPPLRHTLLTSRRCEHSVAQRKRSTSRCSTDQSSLLPPRHTPTPAHG
jgi:hypothetical protein